MSILQSVFLGIVQGLTEFLPISSSGHLAIMQNIFRIDTGDSILFDILLHLGTLLVVLIVFRKDIIRLISEVFGMVRDLIANIGIRRHNKNVTVKTPLRRIIKNNYRKLAILLIVSTIPTAMIGYFGKKLVADASRSLIIPGICLIATAILLFQSDRMESGRKIPRDITYREGVIVGIAQGFAVLPGLSRSGTTITACLYCGFDRIFAVKFSFLLSIPAILGAAVLEIGEIDPAMVTTQTVLTYAAGMAAAAVTGYFCMKWMLALVKKKKLSYFAFYCFVIGAVAVIGHFVM